MLASSSNKGLRINFLLGLSLPVLFGFFLHGSQSRYKKITNKETKARDPTETFTFRDNAMAATSSFLSLVEAPVLGFVGSCRIGKQQLRIRKIQRFCNRHISNLKHHTSGGTNASSRFLLFLAIFSACFPAFPSTSLLSSCHHLRSILHSPIVDQSDKEKE